MANVTVYAFTGHHMGTDKSEHLPVKATRAAIARLVGAVVIEASAEEVDASLLDEPGFYTPKAKKN